MHAGEERRRASDDLAEAEMRKGEKQREIEELTKRMRSLESELATAQASAERASADATSHRERAEQAARMQHLMTVRVDEATRQHAEEIDQLKRELLMAKEASGEIARLGVLQAEQAALTLATRVARSGGALTSGTVGSSPSYTSGYGNSASEQMIMPLLERLETPMDGATPTESAAGYGSVGTMAMTMAVSSAMGDRHYSGTSSHRGASSRGLDGSGITPDSLSNLPAAQGGRNGRAGPRRSKLVQNSSFDFAGDAGGGDWSRDDAAIDDDDGDGMPAESALRSMYKKGKKGGASAGSKIDGLSNEIDGEGGESGDGESGGESDGHGRADGISAKASNEDEPEHDDDDDNAVPSEATRKRLEGLAKARKEVGHLIEGDKKGPKQDASRTATEARLPASTAPAAALAATRRLPRNVQDDWD